MPSTEPAPRLRMVINGVAAAVAREPDFAATGVRLRDLPPLPDGRFPSVAE